MKPPIVAPVTNPSNHRINSTIAIVYSIKLSFRSFAGRSETPQPAAINCSFLGHWHADGHVVDHAVHAVEVGCELGHQAFFRGIFGHATHGNHAVRG